MSLRCCALDQSHDLDYKARFQTMQIVKHHSFLMRGLTGSRVQSDELISPQLAVVRQGRLIFPRMSYVIHLKG